MHSGILKDMLPHKLDPLKGKKRGIKGALPFVRAHGGMGLYPMKGNIKALKCHAADIDTGIGSCMHHERKIDILKASFLLHNDLSADRLLRRCPIDHDLIGLILTEIPKCQSSSDHRRSLHVMSAGMTDPFQRIVLCQKSKGRTSVSLFIDGTECSREICDPALDLKSLFFQIIGKDPTGADFLKSRLRQIINPVCHFGKLCHVRRNGLLYCFFLHISILLSQFREDPKRSDPFLNSRSISFSSFLSSVTIRFLCLTNVV